MAVNKRLTQKDIAQLAGVSQATVSLVLNGAPSSQARIPQDTRERVEKVIKDTGYVADPVARRMVKGINRILGVFTYEPAFPSGQADFFTPFLFGIEEAAQALGYDLLLLTGAGKQRKIFGENVRLRLADGCLILGRKFDTAELARLVAGDFPFVAVGRRDDAGGFPMSAATMLRQRRRWSSALLRWDMSVSPMSASTKGLNPRLTAGTVSAAQSAMPSWSSPFRLWVDRLPKRLIP